MKSRFLRSAMAFVLAFALAPLPAHADDLGTDDLVGGQTFTYTDEAGVEWWCETAADGGTTTLSVNMRDVPAEAYDEPIDVVVPSSIEGRPVVRLTGRTYYRAVRSISIPASVTSMEGFSAQGATDSPLAEVTFAPGSTLREIPKDAFRSNPKLARINLPDSVRAIGDYAFYGCYGLPSIDLPAELRTIGSYAFAGTGLPQVEFPDKLEAIGDNAFYEPVFYWDPVENEMRLTELVFPDSLRSIGAYAFVDATRGNLSLSSIESVTFGSGLQSIGEAAFKASGVEQVVFPAALEHLGDDAFEGCEFLTRVTWDDPAHAKMTELGGAFANSGLESIELPDSIEVIGASAFAQCEYLERIELPANLRQIGGGAFSGTAALARIAIPGSVTLVDTQAFASSGITQLAFLPGAAPLTIGEDAFRWCTDLAGSTVHVPARLAELGAGAFWNIPETTFYLYSDHVTLLDLRDALSNAIGGTVDPALAGRWAPDDFAYDDGTVPVSVPDPWGDASYRADPDWSLSVTSTVYYPETLDAQTSPDLALYLELVRQGKEEAAGWGPGTRHSDCWPTFATFDAGEQPIPADPGDAQAAAGTLQVTCTGAGGTGANVCVVDAEGALAATAKATLGLAQVTGLDDGVYTVLAFASNPYFTAVGAESDFASLGLGAADYAKAEGATVSQGAPCDVVLDVPAIDISRLSNLVAKGGLIMPGAQVVSGVDFFATVNFTLAAGRTASQLKVTVPDGLEVLSVASAARNYTTAATFSAATRTLTVPLDAADAQTGRLYLGLRAARTGTFSVNASVVTGGAVAPVGGAVVKATAVALDLPAGLVAGGSFDVTVHAAPGQTVTVEAEGATVELGPTNRAGRATGTVTLPDGGSALRTRALVTATAPDGERASGTVSFDVQLSLTSDVPQLREFSFVHANERYWLVRDGKADTTQPYYTYVANGEEKNKYWTFEAKFSTSQSMAGLLVADAVGAANIAQLQVQMLDGSSRYQDMTLRRSVRQADGTYLNTVVASMYIDQAGDHVFASSLVPTAFDVSWQRTVESAGDLPQPVVDRVRDLLRPWTTYVAEVRSSHPAGLSADDETWWDLTDASDVVFTRITETRIWTYYAANLEPDQVQALRDIDQGIQDVMSVCTGLGGGGPLEGYDDWGTYIADIYDIDTGLTYDAPALENAGWNVTSDPNAATATGRGTPTGRTDETGAPTVAAPSSYATRTNTDRNGHPTSYSYRDSNGNAVTVPVPDYLSYDAAGGASFGVNWDLATKGMGLIENGLTVFGDDLSKLDGAVDKILAQAGLGADIHSDLAGFAKKANKVLSYGGAALGIAKAKLDSDGYVDDVTNLEDMKGLVQNLEIQQRYYAMPGHGGTSSECYKAVTNLLDCAKILANAYAAREQLSWLGTTTGAGFTAGGLIAGLFTGGAATAAGVTLFGGDCTSSVLLDSESWRNADQLAVAIANYKAANARAARACGKDFDAAWNKKAKLDPSGVVYEAVESNVLSGVTATVWDSEADEPWDGEAYDEVNPQVTGADGSYAWNVPAGSWQVRFQKDGYEDAATDVLQVPPPQLGLATAMVSRDAPEATACNAGTDYVEVVFSQYMMTGSRDVLVTVDGTAVTGTWADPAFAREGDEASPVYARVLHVPSPAGLAVGDSVDVVVQDAVNYAGAHLARPIEFKGVEVQARPAEIRLNFPNTICLQAGTSRPTTVRVFDAEGDPVEGAVVHASLDTDFLATVDDTGAVTGADGSCKVQLAAELPGLCALTLSVEGTSLARSIDLLVTADAVQAARPTAQLGLESVDAGAAAESHVSVFPGTRVRLACADEDAAIYYTTDGTCPCQDTPSRQRYTGPIDATDGMTLIAAAYVDGKDYSERLTLHLSVAPLPANPFADVAAGAYYYEPVLWAEAFGITTGTSPTTFSPAAACKRAQVVTFLWRAAGKPEPASTENPFSDVVAGSYYEKAVLWAAEQGITTGNSPTTFNPEGTCSRGQVVTFLHRFEGLPAASAGSGAAAFADVAPDAYYAAAVAWAAGAGITTGTSPTTFNPNGACTRGHVVTFLSRDVL